MVAERWRQSAAWGTARGSLLGRVFDDPAALTFGAFVVVAPQLLGGVFPWGIIAIASGALCCLLLAIWKAVQTSVRDEVSHLTVALCAAFGLTILQCVPLPCSIVDFVNPDAALHLRRALRALGSAAPMSCTLSEDPGRTREEVLKGCAIVASFITAWLLSASGSRKVVLWSVALSTLLMAVVALAHGALGMERVFGWYAPRFVRRQLLLAPLMNPNNLGGFIAMGVPVWIGLSVRERIAPMRVFTYGATAITSATVLLTLSRGAIAVLMATFALLISLAALRGQSSKRHRKPAWFSHPGTMYGSAAVAIGLGAAVYAVSGRLFTEFRTGGLDKIDLIGAGFELARRYPWVGVGRGAFSSTFVSLHGATNRFEYPENLVAQWMSEWGILMGGALIVAILVALRRRVQRATSMRRLGGIVGVLAIGAHNFVDLGLELVSVAVVAAALLAAVVAPGKRGRTQEQPRRPRMLLLAFAVAGVSAVALTLLGPTLARDSVRAQDTALRELLSSKDRARFKTTLARALQLHPNEPVFALLGAAEGIGNNDPHAGRFINLGMLLAPGWAAPHAQAAEWLWRMGRRSQAVLELRAAAAIDFDVVSRLACAMMKQRPEVGLAAAPANEQRRRYLETIATCLPLDHPSSQQLDATLVREFPASRWPWMRRAERSALAGRNAEAVSELDAALRTIPGDSELLRRRIELLASSGRTREALDATLAAQNATPVSELPGLLRLRAHAAAKLGEHEIVKQTLTDLRGLAGFEPAQLASVYSLEGSILSRDQRHGAALHAFEEAYRIHPTSERLRAVAQAASALGDKRRATSAYVALCSGTPPDPAACAQRNALLGKAGSD